MPTLGGIGARETKDDFVAVFIVPVEWFPPVLGKRILTEFTISDSLTPADYVIVVRNTYPFLSIEVESHQERCCSTFGE